MDDDHVVADVLVNRDEPLPIINAPGISESSSDVESKFKKSGSGTKLKDKIQHAATTLGHGGDTLQDKLMAK